MHTTTETALSRKIASLAASVEAMHNSIGVLIDDVADIERSLHDLAQDVRSFRVDMARMDARVRKLEGTKENGRLHHQL